MTIQNIFILCLSLFFLAEPQGETADILAGFAAPITTPARSWLIVGGTLTAVFLVFQDKLEDPVTKKVIEGRPLGKFSFIGDCGGRMYSNILYSGGMFLASALGNENAAEKGKVMLQASLSAVTVSTLLKVTVREPRPNDGRDKKSFPSGHTTAAFAFASVVGAEDGWPWGIPAYALATLTGYSRMNDNKHFLHDVLAGATIGTSYGLGIHYLKERKTSSNSLSIIPIWDSDQKGLELSYRF